MQTVGSQARRAIEGGPLVSGQKLPWGPQLSCLQADNPHLLSGSQALGRSPNPSTWASRETPRVFTGCPILGVIEKAASF